MPTLIVEDGSGVPDANSYVDLDFANTYLQSHYYWTITDGVGDPQNYWVGTDDQKTQALLTACESMELLYGPRYLSYRLDDGSSGAVSGLVYPRYAFYDRNGIYRPQNSIPIEIKRAQCDLASGLMGGVMSPTPNPNPNAYLTSSHEKAGAVEAAYTYSKPQEIETFAGYRKVDLLLWSLLKPMNPPLVLSR